MKKIIFSIVIVVCFCANLKAQVIQQKADKWQLINGVKLESKTPKKNLIKLKEKTRHSLYFDFFSNMHLGLEIINYEI